MADTTEEQKKAVVPFLQRAQEIERVEPKIAYYCRMYAVEQGLALPARSPQIDGLLGALLSKLEKDKPLVQPGTNDAAYCEKFALSVFARADKVDRAGRADKATATAFYAASIFFEILNQFGPLASDLAEMQRYAAWKAADIRKAVREGRTPTPGPPGGDGAGGSGSLDLPSPPGDDLPAPPPPGKPATIPRSESDVGGGGGVAAPPRHAPGAAVVYCHDGFPPAVAGTVAKVNPPEGLGVTYVVALADQVVSAFEAQLAPALEPGADVVVKPEAGDGASDAPPPGDYVVQSVDTSVWRPRYTLEPKGGGKTVTVDDGALASWPPPRGRAPKPPKQTPPFAAPHPPAGSVEPPSAPAAPEVAAPAAPAASAPAAPAASAPAAPAASAPAAPAASAPAAPLPQPSIKAMQDAIKASKSAISSLQFEDVPTAVKYLTEALDLLS